MNHRQSFSALRNLLICAFAATLVAGCGGSHLDPVLGTPGEVVTLPPVVVPAETVRPTVVVTVPAAGAVDVPVNRAITAQFSEDMAPATISATSFTVRNTTTDAAVAGVVSYTATSRTATFTPSAVLPLGSQFRATVTAAATDLAGNGLAGSAAALPNASDHVWTFSTGVAPDTARPSVTTIVPASDAIGVAVNQSITAAFSEAMSGGTIPGSFTLTESISGTTVSGNAVYSASSPTVTFTPVADLPFSTAFTVTITPAATDLAGNPLLGNAATLPATSDYTWEFTTGPAPDLVPPEVLEVFPDDGATASCATNAVFVRFSEPMLSSSINALTFLVSVDGIARAGDVSYDGNTRLAQFVTTNGEPFPGDSVVAIRILAGAAGVEDLAGNKMVDDFTSNFTASIASCLPGVDLGEAAPFGAFGGRAGITNDGIVTNIEGDLGTTAVCTAVTGFRDSQGFNYTTPPLNNGLVQGTIYCSPPPAGASPDAASIAEDAISAAGIAYYELTIKPGQLLDGDLRGQTLAPGVYTATGGSFGLAGNVLTDNLTLDAGGDPDGVFVFQMSTSLTVGSPGFPRQVILTGGAQAANVYWQVGTAATITEGSAMVGTIIAQAGVTFSTTGSLLTTTLVGRALSLGASVTMTDTVITKPPPPLIP